MFISSASAYCKPLPHPVITESTPLGNPFWEYARNKIACERLLERAWEDSRFPYTVVRPSHTYDDGWIPTCFGSRDYTVARRMLDGKEIVVPGDGQSLWTLTHASDFARGFTGLLGNPTAIGQAFHITSDESLTWDSIHQTIGRGLGADPRIVHVPSDFVARVCPERGTSLLGDKAHSVIFDNAKIRRYVPGFLPTMPLRRRNSAIAGLAGCASGRQDGGCRPSMESTRRSWSCGRGRWRRWAGCPVREGPHVTPGHLR